jgi:4-nitrophenyl phosphatase
MNSPIRNLILDMDGVLWHGETAMPGLVEMFDTMRRLGINHVLATNNASKTVEQYTAKLARFGVTIEPERILTSSLATAGYLRRRYPMETPVYIVGDAGLRQAMADYGFQSVQLQELPEVGDSVEVVVVGLTRHLTYGDLAAATLFIRRGAAFIGANPDRTYPSEYGELPGAGAILAFLEASTGRTPTVIGKPGTIMFDRALEQLNGRAAETAMVGDRIETDIVGARAAGLRTILLLSGVTTPQLLATSDVQPDVVLQDIAALAAYLEASASQVYPVEPIRS